MGRAIEGARPDNGALDVDLRAIASALPARIDATPEGVEQGLAKLVLTIIEVLRKVLEHQAVRRNGRRLAERMRRSNGSGWHCSLSTDGFANVKTVFGLSDEELEIDLGPLGRIR